MDEISRKAASTANKTWINVDTEKNGYIDCYEFYACLVLACSLVGYPIPKIISSNNMFIKYTQG